MVLTRLWTGMRTRDQEAAGTDEQIVLIINDNGTDDLLHHTFEDTKQEDQERGKANLYEVLDVELLNIIPANFNKSSIRVGIRGPQAWIPEDFFVFGEDDNGHPIPLALATDIVKLLSTEKGDNDGDARLSIPIPLVNLGSSSTVITRLLVLMLTDKEGTDSQVQLRISDPASIFVDFDMPPPAPQASQDHQDANQANFYYAEVDVPFTTKEALGLKIKLSLQKPDDDWLPASFFLFGLDTVAGPPTAIVPLVHIPEWTFGQLDSATSSVVLPLVPTN